MTKVGHWGFPEKAGAWLLRRKSGDLLSMPHSPLSDRRGRILLSEKRPERHFAAAPAFSCRLPPCGVFCTTDGFAGPSPFLSPGGIPPGDKNLKKGQLKGIAPGMGSRYNRICISAERTKRKIGICRGKTGHRTTLSFRTSAHTGVGISIEFQAAYRHTVRSILPFSGIHP